MSNKKNTLLGAFLLLFIAVIFLFYEFTLRESESKLEHIVLTLNKVLIKDTLSNVMVNKMVKVKINTSNLPRKWYERIRASIYYSNISQELWEEAIYEKHFTLRPKVKMQLKEIEVKIYDDKNNLIATTMNERYSTYFPNIPGDISFNIPEFQFKNYSYITMEFSLPNFTGIEGISVDPEFVIGIAAKQFW